MAATESSVTLSWEATVDEEGRVISAYVAHVQTFVGRAPPPPPFGVCYRPLRRRLCASVY